MSVTNKSSGALHKPFRSVRVRINLAVAIVGAVLLVFSLWLLNDSMTMVEEDLIGDRLESDIAYLRDTLGEGEWSIRGDALFLGAAMIGDGTEANAYLEPFYHCEETTGTFFYVFKRTYNDSELVYTGDKDSGYMQGHFVRVAGTTKGTRGESLIGTYIDKKVADAIESAENGVYSGEANVNGRMIYCRYELLRDSRGEAVGIIVDGRSSEEMALFIKEQKTRGAILIVAALILMSVGLGAIVTRMLSSIKTINERLEIITAGELPEEPLILNTNDEMAEIAENINVMVGSLRDNQRIAAELSVASDIQLHMMPSIFPAFPDRDDFDIFAVIDPAKEVGGDFYDFFMIDDMHLAIVVADVSGKGVPAALFMVIAKTLINNFAKLGVGPSDVFTEVNDILCDGNEAGMFVTAWMGILDLESGELTFTNAGHNPPVLMRKDGECEYLRQRHGFILAAMEGTGYQHTEIMLNPGDKLFLYTDGVTEATSGNKELYGEDRLIKYLEEHISDAPKILTEGLRRDIDAFVGAAEQFDDITMLSLVYGKKANI